MRRPYLQDDIFLSFSMKSNAEQGEEDIAVGSFLVKLQPKQVLEDKCELKLQVSVFKNFSSSLLTVWFSKLECSRGAKFLRLA